MSAIRGNHEEALIHGAYGFHLRARNAIDWTRDQLKPGFFSGRVVRERWDFLAQLPLRLEHGPDLFVHGSPRDPTTEYLLAQEVDFGHEKYNEVFAGVDRLVFVGHTHLPCLITDTLTTHTSEELGGSWSFPDLCEAKAIVNVGSVGQPRDGDPRACYVVVDGDRIHWRRVAYDAKATMHLIAKVERLDNVLGERLLIGK